MADRTLNWHIPSLKDIAYYLDKDYDPVDVRIKADVPPAKGDLEIDILCNGVSIFANTTVRNRDFTLGVSEITYNTLSGTFTVGETITGGTSGATGTLIKDNRTGLITLHNKSAASFSVGETITGGSSSATAVVLSYYRASDKVNITYKTNNFLKVVQGNEEDLEGAEFSDDVELNKGSWVTLSLGNVNGANNVSIQLELDEVSEGDEDTELT